MPEKNALILEFDGELEDVARTDVYSFVSSHWPQIADTTTPLLVSTADGREMSLQQLDDVIASTSRDMASGGVRRRSMVAVWCGNCAEIIVAVMAAWKLGAVVAMIGPSLTVDEARRQIVKIRTQFLFVDATHSDSVLHQMFGTHPTIKTVCKLNGLRLLALPGSEVQTDSSIPPIDPDKDTALILFSSGTTGYPKAVQLSHSNLIVYLHLSSPQLTNRPMPPTVHYLPLSHFYGFSMLLRALCDNSPVYMMNRFNIDEFARLVDKYRIPVLFLVPPVSVMLANRRDLFEKYDMSCVLAVFSAAAPMSLGVEKQLQQLFPGLIFRKARQGYGMTETTGAVTRSPTDLGEIDPSGSVGKVLPYTQLMVLDEDTGRPCGPNKRGELVVRGPLNMKGYYDDPEATANIIDKDGWLHTGDIGYYDDNEFVFVVDRAKELIKCRGNQVAPAELEDLLLTHPDVADSAVVGLLDELSGELPTAFIVRKPGSSVTERQLQDFIAGQVAPYKQLAGGVRFVAEIPKLATGKILRRVLRDVLRTNHKL